MFKIELTCELCGEKIELKMPERYPGLGAVLTGDENIHIEEHILGHIPKVDVFDLFRYYLDYCSDDRFDDRKEEIQEIVNAFAKFYKDGTFDNIYNSDIGVPPVLEAAWEVMRECCPGAECCDYVALDVIGENEQNKLRQAVSKTLHETTTKILKDMLFDAFTGILAVLDEWRIKLEEDD